MLIYLNRRDTKYYAVRKTENNVNGMPIKKKKKQFNIIRLVFSERRLCDTVTNCYIWTVYGIMHIRIEELHRTHKPYVFWD